MAETYYCFGQEIHFTNKGAFELQKAWIEIASINKDKDGMLELIEILTENNNGPQGGRAYDIDDSSLDFDSETPLKCWLEINEALINEINRKGISCRLFDKNTELEVVIRWKEKLILISQGISKEIKIKQSLTSPKKNRGDYC